jgi:glycosyltransferase involved in cell wall biosynthesis
MGYVQRAGVYMSSTKETFGLGVLEAMAAGVPVLGWNHGGNAVLVKHGVNGYLAQPGNIDDLANGLAYCLKHRKTLGDNGREMAKAWTWEAACQELVKVFNYALEVGKQPADYAVIIPFYKKPLEYLVRAAKSAVEQSEKPVRVVVVNDGTDIAEADIKAVTQLSPLVTWLNRNNGGVAVARNAGIASVDTKYIICLDADDWIAPTFAEACLKELESDRALGIAYARLMLHSKDGAEMVSDWPGTFEVNRQLTYPPQNQVPTCCMFRREAWERVGGYQSRYCPTGAGTEDAAFWSAVCAIGYNAKLVTEEALFHYQVGENTGNLSIDWLSMYPWAKDKLHPFASVATPKKHSHPVRQYDEPVISVIIPVGPGHENEVRNALDSLEMQTFRKWEAVVVFDTGNQYYQELFTAYPYIRPVFTDKIGAGAARNRGVEAARANLIFYLDADDSLADADALAKFMAAWRDNEAVIYSDYVGKAIWDYEAARKEFGKDLLGYNEKISEVIFKRTAADFDSNLAQRQPEYNPNNKNMPYYHWCLISCLFPKLWHKQIGGFDEKMTTWEDVDYWWRMARAGRCFYRINEPLVLYNYSSGARRNASGVNDAASLQRHKDMIQYLKEKYRGLEVKMCNCGKRKQPPPSSPVETAMSDGDFVEVIFDFPGSDTRSSYGMSLFSPTRQNGPDGRLLDYHGYSLQKGMPILAHVADVKARPDLFKPMPVVEADIPVEIQAPPEPEPVIEPEPEPLAIPIQEKQVEMSQLLKRRGRHKT